MATSRRSDPASRRERNRRANRRTAKVFAIGLMLLVSLFVLAGVVTSIQTLAGHGQELGQSRASAVGALALWLGVAVGEVTLVRWRLRTRRTRQSKSATGDDEVFFMHPTTPPPPMPRQMDRIAQERLERIDISYAETDKPRIGTRRPARSHLTVAQARTLEPVHLCIDGYVPVKGESFYQPHLKAVARGVIVPPRALDQAIPAQAMLVPDPVNPHDSHAVRVEIEGRHIGHLSRDISPDYQPLLLELGSKGKVGVCPAWIMGGGDRYYGVHLYLSDPHLLFASNQPGDLHLWKFGSTVTVTGAEAHQDVLWKLAPPRGADEVCAAFASLHVCAISKGARRGEPTIELRIEGERIGELTKLQADRYSPLLEHQEAAGLRPGCQVYVQEEGLRGLRAMALLPKPAEVAALKAQAGLGASVT